VPAGKTSAELICHVDLFATVAAVVGHKLPEIAAPDSFDCSAALFSQRPAQPGRESLVHQAANPNWLAIRKRNWKCIPPAPGNSRASAGPELYDLATDPSEAKNVAQDHPQKVQELTVLLSQLRQATRTRPVPAE
jgi:arylsulfatase A-like enzyme